MNMTLLPRAKLASPAPAGVVEGRIQRVDYKKRQMWIVGRGEVMHFQVPADCQLRFNGEPAILRCFHPLDPVEVVLDKHEPTQVARCVYSWEK